MNYKKYKVARTAAWEILIDLKIKALPIKISDIFKVFGIQIHTYTGSIDKINKANLNSIAEKSDGFTVNMHGRYTVFYNDTKSSNRIRFTLAHELGHIVCNHIKDGAVTTQNTEPVVDDPEQETQANMFAIRLLAPACVLHELELFSAYEISQVCNISMQSAEFRLQRLMLLEQRNKEFLQTKGYGCYYLSPLERQVHKQFRDYINQNRL